MKEISWCRNVEGQEHNLVLRENGHPPHCQPLRAWVKAGILDPHRGFKLVDEERKLAEEWECFHWEQCTRCRKKTRRGIYRDECPQARPGAVVIADPELP